MKRQNGITLVALVITIIILLILAGISIGALKGSGLFNNAQKAKNETEKATQNELNTLNSYTDEMNKLLK